MENNYKHMYDLCKDHMHAYVLAETQDGSKVDGIITGLDNEYVYLANPIGQPMGYDQWESSSSSFDPYNRQMRYGYPGGGYYGGYYGGPGYGHGGYYGSGFSGGYGYQGGRFRRLVLPLAALTAISLLPWY